MTGGPVPRFEKVERPDEPSDGVVIEGDDLGRVPRFEKVEKPDDE